MIEIAQDSSHGYDQNQRWGERGDYDCSSFTITAFEKAGFPVKSKYGATYTGNMKDAFINCGFKDVRNAVNIATGAGLIRGDVLLNEVQHVAVYIGNGLIVQASINELGRATGGRPGNQTGYEINISKYKNYHRGGWDSVLRYDEKIDTDVLDKKGAVKTMSEKEKEYAVQAINKLAELKLLNSPDVHIKNIDKSNWALWVMIAKLAERR
jgi:hypothetical protein